jgi:hypothetical protein
MLMTFCKAITVGAAFGDGTLKNIAETGNNIRNPLLYRDNMKTSTLIIIYILTKLLFLAALFTRLEGRRLVRARRRSWRKNV